jgi:hypothetical protein
MCLFAESSQDGSFSFLLFMAIMILGLWQWCKWLKGSPTLRGGAKKGAMMILRRIFK